MQQRTSLLVGFCQPHLPKAVPTRTRLNKLHSKHNVHLALDNHTRNLRPQVLDGLHYRGKLLAELELRMGCSISGLPRELPIESRRWQLQCCLALSMGHSTQHERHRLDREVCSPLQCRLGHRRLVLQRPSLHMEPPERFVRCNLCHAIRIK